MLRSRLPALVAVLVLTGGCAARQLPSATAAELDNARALVVAGCYRCLESGLAAYDALRAWRSAPAAAGRGAFEAAVLLVVRARELGLRDDVWLQRARELAVEVPLIPGGPSPTVYLDAVALVGGDLSGLAAETRDARARALREMRAPLTTPSPARHALSPWVETDPIAQYLALAIDCEHTRALKDSSLEAQVETILAREPSPPLRYRAASCGRPSKADQLTAIREADPRWRDTLVFEARHEMSRYPAPDLGRAAELLKHALDAFPQSHAIALDLGNALNASGDYAAALPLFDGILADVPTHREALLGRLLSLSYTNRYYLAVAAASRMIELGTYYLADAYYWRAWNRYQVHDLPAAWSDVERAAALMVNTAVYTLAGFIAYAQRELDVAIDRLSRAYAMDAENCDAAWTEGLVHVDKEGWVPAASTFATAMQCFAGDVTRTRHELTVVESSTWSEPVKARRRAAAQKRADTSDHRRAQSAFNAAGAYARLRQKAEALVYLEHAAQHPLMRDKAAALRASIAKLP